MSKIVRLLTALEVRNAEAAPDGTPRKYVDGRGLYLLASPSSRRWYLKPRQHGIEKTIKLGDARDVTLEQARSKAQAIRSRVANGDDAVTRTFEDVAREWHAHVSPRYA